jgi:hypothetical protein
MSVDLSARHDGERCFGDQIAANNNNLLKLNNIQGIDSYTKKPVINFDYIHRATMLNNLMLLPWTCYFSRQSP